MHDEMWAFISDILRLSVWSAFDDMKKACTAGCIRVLTNVSGVLSLMCEGGNC